MANTRQGLQAAEKAIEAFAAHMGYKEGDIDPESLISDLITDLMHYSDRRDLSGLWLVERAESNYREEGDDDPEYVNLGDSGADDNPYGDEGQTIPDDPEIPAGAPNPFDR